MFLGVALSRDAAGASLPVRAHHFLCGRITSCAGASLPVRAHHFLPSSLALSVADSTAAMVAARRPPVSRACSPKMVVPPGVQTSARSWAGCFPESRSNRPAPCGITVETYMNVSANKPAHQSHLYSLSHVLAYGENANCIHNLTHKQLNTQASLQ